MPQAIEQLFTIGPQSIADILRFLSGQVPLYEGRQMQIRVSPPKRSTQANSYYWGVVLPEVQKGFMKAGAGACSITALHAFFKTELLGTEAKDVLGKVIEIPKSTSRLDSTAFYEYIEGIRNHELVLQAQIVIPEPEDTYKSYRLSEPQD